MILAIGSIAFDNIKTPFATGKRVLGGSLTYFSLAASYFGRVIPVGVVGRDFDTKYLNLYKKHNIDTRAISVAEGKTFSWGGVYGYDLNDRKTLFTHLNVFADFQPVLSKDLKSLPILFLGNIDPILQTSIARQMTNPKLIVADTMNYWIEKKRTELWKTLKLINVLIINDAETRELGEDANLFKAARKIISLMGSTKRNVPTTLIIKRGEYGLLMVTGKKWFSLPAFVLENVFDPTGAGDSFAGGFVGFLSRQKNFNEKTFRQAAVYGTIMASFSVEKLGPKKLLELNPNLIRKRYAEFKQFLNFS